MRPRLLAALALATPILILAGALGAALPSKTGWGFDSSGMDREIAPGDDFFSFANGAWVRRTTIPDDRTSTGLLADLRPAAEQRVRVILESIPAGQAINTQTGKLRALYESFLDERIIEARGAAPLTADLDRIAAARDRDDLAEMMGAAQAGFGSSIFSMEPASDLENPNRYAVYLAQDGLGLPDRDYYSQPRFRSQLTAYTAYAARLLRLAAWPDPDQSAHDIVAFETSIAGASWTHESIRDPLKTNNARTLADLEREAPGFAWGQFLSGAGLTGTKRLIATTDTSLPGIARIYHDTPLKTLRAWLAFRTADNAAPYLSDAFVQAHRSFRLQILAGQPGVAPRWQRGVRLVNTAMGSAAGELYVQRYFRPEREATIKALVEQVRAALAIRIKAASWMSVDARQEALRKLARLTVQVGRPRNWIDYAALTVRPDDLYGNILRTRAFDWQRRVLQLSHPWNTSDWRFWPQQPTAYNENGQMIYTASMLQPPFFDPHADSAINYGAIGSVIGHELSHHFDDQGRMADADGRLRDWWRPDDVRRFKTQATRLAEQYSQLQPLPGLHVNGDVTLGENIADLGGVAVALDAYHLSLGGRAAKVLHGFTGDQRFFLSWAQAWRQKDRDEELRQLIASDVHSPPSARVNGVVRNIDDWYRAWHVKPGQRLYLRPADRVRIW